MIRDLHLLTWRNFENLYICSQKLSRSSAMPHRGYCNASISLHSSSWLIVIVLHTDHQLFIRRSPRQSTGTLNPERKSFIESPDRNAHALPAAQLSSTTLSTMHLAFAFALSVCQALSPSHVSHAALILNGYRPEILQMKVNHSLRSARLSHRKYLRQKLRKC